MKTNGDSVQEVGKEKNQIVCVAWRFWLGAQSNKSGRGQRNREEIGEEQRES